jgi:hypothetical protein
MSVQKGRNETTEQRADGCCTFSSIDYSNRHKYFAKTLPQQNSRTKD